jgi:hypothetical protein
MFKKGQKFYSTSRPITLDKLIEIEVEERENYEIEDIEEWCYKYDLEGKEMIWVSPYPWVAARYQMMADEWDNAKEIYEKNPDEYEVYEYILENENQIIIESDDGDDGYLMII